MSDKKTPRLTNEEAAAQSEDEQYKAAMRAQQITASQGGRCAPLGNGPRWAMGPKAQA